MNIQPSVAVIGSVNIDFAVLTERVPGPGETLTATSLNISAGGKGANQAVACGRAAFISSTTQDVTVGMVGAVGKGDLHYASLVQPLLIKSGVSTNGIEEIDSTPTGTAIVLVERASKGQNRILIAPGANAAVTNVPKLLGLSRRRDGQEPTVVVMQGEIPPPTVFELLRRLDSSGRTATIFNPAPIFPGGIPLPRGLDESPRKLAVLVVNETEWLQALLSWGIGQDDGELTDKPGDAGIDQADLDRHTAQLHEFAGVSIILVTLGSRGVYFSCLGASGTGTPNRGLVPAKRVENVLDTTAAGDTFIGYFAVELARHLASREASLETFEVKMALGKANSAAALCVQRRGAMDSIPFAFELC